MTRSNTSHAPGALKPAAGRDHASGMVVLALDTAAPTRDPASNPVCTRPFEDEVCWGRAFDAGRRDRGGDAPVRNFRTAQLQDAYRSGRFGLSNSNTTPGDTDNLMEPLNPSDRKENSDA